MKNLENLIRNEASKNLQLFLDKMNDEEKRTQIKKKTKEMEKRLSEDLLKIERVKQAGDVQLIVINVEWTKSRVWGMNPKAEIEVQTDKRVYHYQSSRVSGCGYDKESTAIAEALNKSYEVLKLLYSLKESNTDKTNDKLYGYGISGVLPYFDGGVGVSCYKKNFKSIGFDFKGVAHGKQYDVYQIIKIQ